MPGAAFEWQLGHHPLHSGRVTTFRAPPPARLPETVVPKPRELFPGHHAGTILGDAQTHRLGHESHQAANPRTRAVLPSHSAPVTRFMPSVAPPKAPAPDPTRAPPTKSQFERKMDEKKKEEIPHAAQQRLVSLVE